MPQLDTPSPGNDDELWSVALSEATPEVVAKVEAQARVSPAARARAWTIRSYANSLANDFESALELLDRAEEQARGCASIAEQECERARACLGRIQPLVVQGRFDEAIRMGGMTRDHFSALGLREPAARASVNVGNTMGAAGDALGSLSHFDAAIGFGQFVSVEQIN